MVKGCSQSATEWSGAVAGENDDGRNWKSRKVEKEHDEVLKEDFPESELIADFADGQENEEESQVMTN